MQNFSLHDEFFQENYAECSKRVHPITFLEDFYNKYEPKFNKTMSPSELADILQTCVHSPMDSNLIEELVERIQLQKKKNLSLNEFFKVFHEAETTLLLKAEYMRFLLDQNKEIQFKIQSLLEILKGSSSAEGGKNTAKLKINNLLGFKDAMSFVRVKYMDFQFETTMVESDGQFKEKAFELSLKSLDELVDFQVIKLDRNKNLETILGKTKLSFFFLDFLKKNEAKLTIHPGMELQITVEFTFLDKKKITSQMQAKLKDLDKENSRITQEKHGFKLQLGLMLKPFTPRFDPDEFYRFDKIKLETPKILRIFDFVSPEDKESFSKKFPQEETFFARPKELVQEFEPKSIEVGGAPSFIKKESNDDREKERDDKENFVKTFSLEKMKYDDKGSLEKSSIQRKIEHIIEINREETATFPAIFERINQMEEPAFWKRFLLRSDIIGTIYVAAALLLNTQRNIFLDLGLGIGFLVNLQRNKFISERKRLFFFILLTVLSLVIDVFWVIYNSIILDGDGNGNEFFGLVFTCPMIFLKVLWLASLFYICKTENLARLAEIMLK